MLENDFFKAVKTFVFELFKTELAPEAVYHNFGHTLRVVNASLEIGQAENLTDNELEILLLAAWFHDSGFIIDFKNHEEKSKEIVKEYLGSLNFGDDKIKEVCSIIDATKMPQSPKSKLDQIICDADLFHLGSEDFNAKSNLLRAEMEQLCDRAFTEIEWAEKNTQFFNEHKFFTNYAFEKLNDQKALNLLKINKDLKKLKAKEEEQQLKIQNKSEVVKRKKRKEERPERGIETMFRVTLRNHIKLSDIADTKANILLSVSAIIMSVALSTLFPKLDKSDNAYLIYPTLIFILTAVVTMVISILSTRPKVTSGKFTKEDISNKKVNLLFFGNFHKMQLNDFQNGMMEMMNDRDYLYKSLMKDLYFLGIVLNKKYRLLRIAYTVFMIGIVISVLAFIISFSMLELD
ncbi:MAG: phosphohydrolase [Bacteroidetes bacterium MedPE-SWsnd-G1]|nr:MAG: phosphohydrolase [Bacteroidetes bacterium MedPE-SWsnd-G1]